MKVPLMTGLACPEPCGFRTCMNSCRYNLKDTHTDHYCKDHAQKDYQHTQQMEVPDSYQPTVETPLQSLQRQFMEMIDQRPQPKVDRSPLLTKSGLPPVKQEEDEIDADIPELLYSSSESGNEQGDGKENETDSESEEDTPPPDSMDFDYDDALIVKASGVLTNHLRNLVGTSCKKSSIKMVHSGIQFKIFLSRHLNLIQSKFGGQRLKERSH